MFLCQTPGIWGALPKGFQHLWEDTVDIYFNANVADKKTFVFDASKAEKQTINHDKMLDICVEVRLYLHKNMHVSMVHSSPS